MATSFLTLINEVTGTIDECFDDSLVKDVSGAMKDFEFMEIGKTYDCKITLLGDFTKVNEKNSVLKKINRLSR